MDPKTLYTLVRKMCAHPEGALVVVDQEWLHEPGAWADSDTGFPLGITLEKVRSVKLRGHGGQQSHTAHLFKIVRSEPTPPDAPAGLTTALPTVPMSTVSYFELLAEGERCAARPLSPRAAAKAPPQIPAQAAAKKTTRLKMVLLLLLLVLLVSLLTSQVKMAVINAAIASNATVTVVQDNPKRLTSASCLRYVHVNLVCNRIIDMLIHSFRYNAYRVAKNFKELISLGATKNDLQNDVSKG
jgi:hypothetical protein